MTRNAPKRRALLLGCGTFADPSLAPLRSPRRDVDELAGVLSHPDLCRYEVSAKRDCTSQEARLEIERFFAHAGVSDEMNLLYFSCHGVQDRRGRLYFAFADTDKAFLGATAVSAEWVRDCIYSSRSKATLVLVDCCFSGRFIKGMRARSVGPNVETLIQDLPRGSGLAVLTASGDSEASFEDEESAVVRPSYFTDALVKGIASGAADRNRDGRITVDELYEHIHEEVTRGPSPQRPLRLGEGEGALVVADAPRGTKLTEISRLPLLSARGVLGYISFDGEWVVIGKDGVGHIYKGERRYHVSQLSGVAVKAATRWNHGFIQVLRPGVTPAPVVRFGANAGRPSMTDDDSISFANSSNDAISQIREALLKAIGETPGAGLDDRLDPPEAPQPEGGTEPRSAPTPRTPDVERRQGELDGARVVTRIPLGALDSLIANGFDVLRWLAPWWQSRQTALPWLAELAEHLGGPPGSASTPSPSYVEGLGKGMYDAWREAIATRVLPPDRPSFESWLRQPAAWLKPGALLADATIGDLVAARKRVRRIAVIRTTLRVALYVAAGVLLLMEIAAIGVTIEGGWTDADGKVSEDQAMSAVFANLGCSIPLAGLGVLIFLDIRRSRRRRPVAG
ncbi:caspase family protein [Paractinoplanes atraurantiacus]|uniref:Caspase domain-containing protein n=1 Tax=Paractinoplanes atraurantiacus TaxID=1036182 RepID=A0A285HQX8_9ACTN|nr:caspase family protein [Actinoplanes atraurantiacus]SNY38097.1 Caspase domain-containing protein [Actinoplanes atraurantiacus]